MSSSGICKIKPEFIVEDHRSEINFDCVSKEDLKNILETVARLEKQKLAASSTESTANTSEPTANTSEPVENTTEPAANTSESTANTTKPTANSIEPVANTNEPVICTTESTANITVEPAEKKQRLSKAEKRKLKGQNKARRATFNRNQELELCSSLMDVHVGKEHPKCWKNNCKFMHDVKEYLKNKPKDIGHKCYNFRISGHCSRGLTCRYGDEHITKEGWNYIDKERQRRFNFKGIHTVNQLTHETQTSLRKHTYDFSMAEAVVRFSNKLRAIRKNPQKARARTSGPVSDEEDDDDDDDAKQGSTSGTITDEDIIKLTWREKTRVNWKNKIFLSPLTTVGNLPFRRICKEFGADITCGEMAMCSSLLQGAPQEWALVKRHHTEDIFGVQLCANNPYLLTKCGQMLEKEVDIDFIDLNLGCPIDLVYRDGGGCALLTRERNLEICIRSLSHILTVPLTVKTRTGIRTNENLAHDLIPKFGKWGASLVTLHGRSREQRYTRLADWKYIAKCVKIAEPLPVVGNGDVLSFKDYRTALINCPGLTGVMIGRGALIKPWIFEEIKQKKLWDISSSQRFDIIKRFTNYGLEHWGSDTKGVENTRRFLLEWLSFLYRYIPVGVLEMPPQKINERPPRYRGRNDLETLMASPSASDWIKISEMLLGRVPDGFQFLPKHKANAYT